MFSLKFIYCATSEYKMKKSDKKSKYNFTLTNGEDTLKLLEQRISAKTNSAILRCRSCNQCITIEVDPNDVDVIKKARKNKIETVASFKSTADTNKLLSIANNSLLRLNSRFSITEHLKKCGQKNAESEKILIKDYCRTEVRRLELFQPRNRSQSIVIFNPNPNF